MGTGRLCPQRSAREKTANKIYRLQFFKLQGISENKQAVACYVIRIPVKNG
jgi:hypothetical protein